MPYSKEHTRKTRASIIESARILFNVHGFQSVTIDMVMKRAGLTRGGFYTHFKNKEELFAAAISSFLMGRGAQWRDEAGIDVTQMRAETAEQMISSYLSDAHLGDVEDQCPMIALPSDVARSGDEVKGAYQELLTAMVWLFESSLEAKGKPDRSKALSLAATCVGGMILARTLPDSALAEEVRAAALASALA
ncbi:MAG: TetR/AcrR family transcriptional regulator [Litoreibacter sp.]|uniref:TetR/AcrR family transcriptional regulator n=1 Tax=Litoreibacter sp. TaxID=1969459 RepID=UPI0032982CA9